MSIQNHCFVSAETKHKTQDNAEATCSAVLERVKARFEFNNMLTARNFWQHQPRHVYDANTFDRLGILRPSSYSILANPEKFDGKIVAFTGYLERYSHHCCPFPGDECYHIFITRDDYRNHTESHIGENYVHLRVNKHFFEGTAFLDGSLVEGVGLLKAGNVAVDTGVFRQDSASTLTNGSMRFLRIFSPDTESQPLGKARSASREDFMRFSPNKVAPNLVWEIRAGKITEDADKVEASGGVLVSIDDQDAELNADCVVYDKKGKILRTIGNVKIVLRGQLTTGQRFDFKVASDEYLVTETNVKLGEPLLKVRSGNLTDF